MRATGERQCHLPCPRARSSPRTSQYRRPFATHTHTHTQLSSFPPPATRKTGNVGTKTAALKVQRVVQRVQSTGCHRRRRGCQVPGARYRIQELAAGQQDRNACVQRPCHVCAFSPLGRDSRLLPFSPRAAPPRCASRIHTLHQCERPGDEGAGGAIGFSSVLLVSAHLPRAYTPFVVSLYPPAPSLLPSATPAPRALLQREK